MKHPDFKVSFAYAMAPAPFTHNDEAPKLLETTQCIVEDPDGNLIADATVVPFHKAVANRLYARKIAFEKAMGQVKNRGTRRMLWTKFRKECAQPEMGRIRIKGIEMLLKNFPGIESDDYEELSKAIRNVLVGAKKIKNLGCTLPEEEPVIAVIPNAEPMKADLKAV